MSVMLSGLRTSLGCGGTGTVVSLLVAKGAVLALGCGETGTVVFGLVFGLAFVFFFN
jgi:hypothetical protein